MQSENQNPALEENLKKIEPLWFVIKTFFVSLALTIFWNISAIAISIHDQSKYPENYRSKEAFLETRRIERDIQACIDRLNTIPRCIEERISKIKQPTQENGLTEKIVLTKNGKLSILKGRDGEELKEIQPTYRTVVRWIETDEKEN